MNSKRFFVFAILLYCNLFLSSCSSDLNFDQINDFSAEPEIVGNLAYFEYLSNTAAPLFSIEKTVPFDFVNEKFVANNVDYVKLLFELESKEARNYQVELVFKDEFYQPIENITIDVGAKDKAEVELLKLHPDFSEIRKEDAFHNWAAKQDPVIQNWLYENTSNAQLAGRAIDLYKMDKGTSTLNKKQGTAVKKEAAKAITKTSKATESDIPTKKIWSNSEIGKMDRRTFAKFEAEIDEASREGRIQP